MRGNTEGDVRDAKAGEHTGQFPLHGTNTVDSLYGGACQLLLSRRHGEGQHVENDSVGLQAVIVAQDSMDATRDTQLALGGVRHPLLIDSECDHCRAVLHGHRDDRVDTLAAVLQVHRVDDCAARIVLECSFYDRRLGAVDHQWCLDTSAYHPEYAPHLLRLIGALGQRDTQIE